MNEKTITNLEKKTTTPTASEKDDYEPVKCVAVQNQKHIKQA